MIQYCVFVLQWLLFLTTMHQWNMVSKFFSQYTHALVFICFSIWLPPRWPYMRGSYWLKPYQLFFFFCRGVDINVMVSLSQFLSEKAIFWLYWFTFLFLSCGFILNSSDDNKARPFLARRLLLWPFICLCCAVWLQLCGIDARSNLPDTVTLMTWQNHT